MMNSRESDGIFRYGNYRREAEDLRSVILYFSEQKYEISAILGHSKGKCTFCIYWYLSFCWCRLDFPFV